MAYEYHHSRRVYWIDTDVGGIIHYTNYFRYMEEAETEFMRSVGIDMLGSERDQAPAMPRVHAEADFLKPVTAGDLLDVHLKIASIGRSSITFEYVISHEGEKVARGKIITACVGTDSAGKLSSAPIPDSLRERIEVAPAAD